MKKLYILTAFILFGSVGLMAQERTEDENGRPIGAKPTNTVASAPAVFIQESTTEASNSATVSLSYSLPENMNSGKMVVFHPSIDKELKTIQLLSRTGTVNIDLTEVGLEEFVVGMYDANGNFIQEYRIRKGK
jgi:hypothetical protein